MPIPNHLDRFYDILADLDHQVGKRQLKDSHGRMNWPRRGVYFFFEDGELRPDGKTPRVVRVGTHAVSAGSKTTLWNRLITHRGTQAGVGNHRGSIFRLRVGEALLRLDETLAPKPSTWGKGSSAKCPVRDAEAHVEQAVSAYIGSMPFLWIDADDEPGTGSIRRVIERNALALLSCSSETGSTADHPSANWLGHHCPKKTLRRSGLWNVNDVDGHYDPKFLDRLESCVAKTGSASHRETIALVSCVKNKASGPCPAKDLYTSALFRYMRAYAEGHADRWFILSARHGLVDPEATLVAYEQALNNTSAQSRREWAQRVYRQMRKAGLLRGDTRFLWLAGKKYQRDLSLLLKDFEQHDPLAGLGIGKRLAWLKAETTTA